MSKTDEYARLDIHTLRSEVYELEKTVSAIVDFLDIEVIEIPAQSSRKKAIKRDSGRMGG